MESVVKKLMQSMTSSSPGNMKDKDKEEEMRFLKNGSKFLKEIIADCNGKSIPIRSFSSSQILQATNNFHSSCLVRREWDHKGYKGTIEGKTYLIKRFFKYSVKDRRVGETYNDIVLSARMSNHSNFLKLFGSCLEFSFFDRNWTAKLSDLSYAISLPEGKSRIKTGSVMGRVGYLDPLYLATSCVTEYTDVYSFGVFLMVILTGRPALLSTGSDRSPQCILSYVKGLYENGKVDELIDPVMMEDMTNGQALQLEASITLALRCCEERDEDRLKMIQVAKELKRIERIE